MARFRRALHGVASSYLLLAATAAFSLLSVPIALHYLDKPRFGLWALMSSIVGYLSLVDVGMTGSAARLMIDHKDDRDGGVYGGFLKAVFIVTALQGLIVFVVGTALSGWFAELLAIPDELHSEFTGLLTLQCTIMGVSFALKLFGLILSGHQRMDLVNYAGILSLLVNLASLWIFFHLGRGVFSLSWAAGCASVTSLSFQAIACGVLKFYPGRGNWGKVSWLRFKEIFNFAKELFLVSVGTQLIMASQSMIITRTLGLSSAALWNVGLRNFGLVNQFIWRVSDMSWPALAEMLSRNEIVLLGRRYHSLAILSFSLAGWAAVTFAACNSLFVTIWTHGTMFWPMENDCLLAIWMVLQAILHCHNCFVLLTKKIGFMRYIYFVEGIVFVSSCLLVARHGGLPAIIGCSIICSSAFSGAYGIWRTSQFFGISFSEVAFGWLRPMGLLLLCYIPVVVLVDWAMASAPGMARLAVNAVLAVSVGAFLFLRFGIPGAFQNELLGRAPRIALPFLRKVFPRTAH